MFTKEPGTLLKGVLLAAFLQAAVLAQPPATRSETLYSDSIQPLFEKNCLPCHGPQTRSAGFDLSTRAGLLRGGEHGAAIVPGDPKASLLYKLVSHEAEPHMPMKGDRLPQESIDRIADWIKAGAPSEPADDAKLASFRTNIKPLLEAKCVNCHNSKIKRSGFDLSTREALLRGGDTGPAVSPGDAASSALFKRISHLMQPGMPFGGQKLPDAAIGPGGGEGPRPPDGTVHGRRPQLADRRREVRYQRS